MDTASNIDEQIAALSPAKKALFEQLRREREAASSSRIPRRTNQDRAPLSFAQQRLFFLDQLEPGKASYNVPVAKRISGPLDVESLEKAINEITRRHESLRTGFSMNGSEPFQHFSPPHFVPLPVTDISYLPAADRETEAKRLARNEQARTFDLMQPPLLRAALLKLSDDDHLLLLTLHHIACDGWSLGILTDELTTLYEAFSAGRPSPLPELAIQYADYAVWQRQQLQGQALTRLLSYWKSQLSNISGALDLPTDYSRPQLLSYRGASHVVTLPKHLIERLTRIGQQEGATLFMTLLAAFQTLLYRYTGQTDIVVGTPIANRRRTEAEKLIGFFVNTLALRTDVRPELTFQQLLKRVKDVALEAYAHQDLPFEKLVQELQPERILNRNPLFDVLFAFQNAPTSNAKHSPIRPSVIETEYTKFDLEVYLSEAAEGVRCKFVYSTDLFEAETAKRMMVHFQLLLESIASNPGERLANLQILPEEERRQLLFDWNANQTSYFEKSLVQLFEEQAARSPHAVALLSGKETVTYAELNKRANQLAHYLMKLGAGPERVVGICVERSVAMVVGLMGILKAGAAYLPLDPAYPRERLQFMARDSDLTLLLTERSLVEKFDGTTAPVLLSDELQDGLAAMSGENLGFTSEPDGLAYLMYTSGSTGQPKGVAATHRATMNRFCWMWRVYPFGREEVCCQKTSLSFGDSVWEIFGPLLQGTASVIIPDEILKDPFLFVETLGAHGVTRLVLVPSLLRVLLETVPELQQKLPKLKFWVTSGEALPGDLVEKFSGQLPQSLLLNLYGASEVAADVTCYEVAGGESSKSIPIGRPISNTEIYILDSQMQPVPIGVVGELYIGGTNLARGYHNRPDLTAEKFVVNPFGKAGGGRLYRTGDLACYRPDGNIEYRGRVDNQVKLRGFRIELGEIEGALRRHAAVADAVVVLREDQASDPRLVAYVVESSATAVQTSELRSFLRQTLPDYMVPSIFVTMEALPLTRGGKVDRQALPKPEASNRELQQRFVAPRNVDEERIAAIWQTVLQVDRVGIRDNFFELGGHSMSAMQLMSELSKAYGKRIPLATLFQVATVEHLAQFIANDEPYAQLTLLQIKPGKSHPPFFCVSAPNVNALGYVQLAQHLAEDQPVYALQAAFRKRSEGEYSPDEVEALATEYIRSMRQLQPEGPYMLGGMCAGGLIAFEMARQLREKGQQIALVGIFDTWNIHTYTWLWVVDYYWRRFKTLLRQARRGDFNSAMRTAGRSLRTVLKKFLPGAVRPQASVPDDPWRTGYVPPPDFVPNVYPGRLTVFRIHKRPYYRINDEALGWGQRALGGVDIEVIPGDHDSIFREPNVRVLAEKLTEHIMAIRAGDVPTTVKGEEVSGDL